MEKSKKDHVSFEQALKLKEKGFNQRTEPYRYNKDGELTLLEGLNAPEKWMVIEWLIVNHGYYIVTTTSIMTRRYESVVYDIRGEKAIRVFLAANYEFPQVAISEAIDYVLNNLI